MITPIVAGADGSEESLAATAWAAVTAARRHVPLCIVHVVEHDPGRCARSHLVRHDLKRPFRHDLRHHARSVLARASRRAIMAAPDVELHGVAVCGQAGEVLTAISARVPLLVLGKRGATRSAGPRLGSVALRLASSARCPVVFAAPESSPAFREILVGTAGTGSAAPVLGFGFGEAACGHAKITALHIWSQPQARIEGYQDWMLSVGPVNASAAAALAEQVAPWRQRYPDVPVTESTVHGQPGRVLSMFSGHADLVVIGDEHARPGGPAPGPGSSADSLLRHCQCPVAVVPGGASRASADLSASQPVTPTLAT